MHWDMVRASVQFCKFKSAVPFLLFSSMFSLLLSIFSFFWHIYATGWYVIKSFLNEKLLCLVGFNAYTHFKMCYTRIIFWKITLKCNYSQRFSSVKFLCSSNELMLFFKMQQLRRSWENSVFLFLNIINLNDI